MYCIEKSFRSCLKMDIHGAMVNHITKFFIGTSLGLSLSAQGTIIGFWDFNDGFDFEDEVPQIEHNASIGSGVLYQQRAETDGNGKGGNTFTDVVNGIDTSGASNERSIAWDDVARSGDNDAELFLVIDTTGFQNITLSFDGRVENEPDVPTVIVSQFDIEASTVPLVDVTNPGDVIGTIKDFGDIPTDILNNGALALSASFQRFTFDLSAQDFIENEGTVAIRLDDFNGNDGNGQLRIDNLLITGTAIPEPSSIVLLGLGGFALVTRRRRLV